MAANEEWYGIQMIYRLTGSSEPAYEERIIIVKASEESQAFTKAEELSKSYEDETTVYVGYAMAYHIADESGDSLGSGTEVFSMIRKSDLPPKKYLDRFHDTGEEFARGFTE